MTLEQFCTQIMVTETELASIVGCSVSYISKLKYNKIRPNDKIKAKLEALGITINMEDLNTYKTKKNEKIEQLLVENRRLTQENKYLKESLIPKIEKLLEKQLKQLERKQYEKTRVN